ncbi:catechol 2,3-dioxygenase-like lactoylglutathione lyase family enzyme [Nocardioides panaciterrulae]|uniref:Catechol 2,3-dioxygenase-like lactoylglutathione lyase family enzyme n=1 Tax=Nocardioides panaciterrulae TaxID=661492 RepID=A0A7Y9E627_9ACTN|nr:VOC family protein [Nocardioides panaciterrulae]NYD41914.1 catechol 2,3-dioxygenase-like lactoylglutathione lyase family enzyme [Nocardioides panaciterrulae]
MIALTFSSPDPERLAGFWGGLLGQDVTIDRGAPSLAAPPEVGFGLRFVVGAGEKWGANQMHPDLKPTSVHEQASAVQRALESGARHLDVGQGPDAEHVVLADPDGNELCILEPGGSFLAGCPFFSSLAGDGVAEVGYFWRDALAWNLVWDQDGETAVQAPTGGPKITWGGEPVAPKLGRNRLHLDLTPSAPATIDAEVERLSALGATRVDAGCADGVGMADPGGNEFCVVG